MTMLIVCIALWSIGIILLKTDFKTESTKWAAILCFSCGFGGFAVFFKAIFVYYLPSKYHYSPQTMYLFRCITEFMINIALYGAPYCIFIFSLLYANILAKNSKNLLKIILFIPVIFCYFYFPLIPDTRPKFENLFYQKISLWAVPYIFLSIFLLIYTYSKETTAKLKKQKLLVIVVLVPSMTCAAFFSFLLRCWKYQDVWEYYSILIPIQFLMFMFFAKKYGILGTKLEFKNLKNVLEIITSQISDAFFVVDEELEIIEVNKIFFNSFGSSNKYKKFNEFISNSSIHMYKEEFLKIIETKKSVNFEIVLENNNDDNKYYNVEISSFDTPMGIDTLILFKDITVFKKNIELIKENQRQLIEQERFFSLSQLIGGIAHNLKTPLMSSSGGIYILKRNSLELKKLSTDHYINNIADEMLKWEDNIYSYLNYMSDIIEAVKGQLSQINIEQNKIFLVKDIVNKINFLMSYELKKNKCLLEYIINIESTLEIKGDINLLVQVLNNLITNAIYISKPGDKIIFKIHKDDKFIIISITDNGKGIPEEIQKKLFKKMITTKGSNGTGLGLYISHSIIEGMFGGILDFTSSKQGTTFYVKLPMERSYNHFEE